MSLYFLQDILNSPQMKRGNPQEGSGFSPGWFPALSLSSQYRINVVPTVDGGGVLGPVGPGRGRCPSPAGELHQGVAESQSRELAFTY